MELDQRFACRRGSAFGDKKLITEENFEEVYAYWAEIFENPSQRLQPSRYFVNDIQHGRSQVMREEGGRPISTLVGTRCGSKKILAEDYDRFWSLHEKVRDPDVTRGIRSRS